jgi:hypothetical protein
MQRSWYDVHEEAAGEAEEVQVGEGGRGSVYEDDDCLTSSERRARAFMKMMTALQLRKKSKSSLLISIIHYIK